MLFRRERKEDKKSLAISKCTLPEDLSPTSNLGRRIVALALKENNAL
jgi:hypothetical protein